MTPGSRGDDDGDRKVDSGSALQSFFDHIPITAIPGIRASVPVLEVKFDDCVAHAIRLLYENNVSGAAITDPADSASKKSMDRDIGFIEFSSMVLWSLEEIDKARAASKEGNHGFFDTLEKYSQIGQTKIIKLTKSFLWEPFFLAHEDDTLFHVLLLCTKHHKLNVIPVIESSNSSIVGFITQHAVIQLLLQSSGLEWFDEIAEKSLSEYGLMNAAGVVSVFSDQSLPDALHVLWDKQLDGVPVVDRRSGTLLGCVRRSDIYLLLEDDSLFIRRKTFAVEEFIKVRDAASDQSRNRYTETEAPPAGLLRMKNARFLRLSNPEVLRKCDSLKKTMEIMAASMRESGFLVGDAGRLDGMVTLRDVILPFSPPSMDARVDGGGFFTSVLNQVGCHVNDGVMIRNR
ncbi:SNF1-related protein kinase regulatory subunit gamma-1-like [Musa acuminata AAA Group]|uniref:SNF1-related protein kinase regulatory subunit gamma-1-like n=1 Tax=Musa acuminata AAA Group TaxID=214697 RepID=UPI0031DE3F21